jgi:hypothetical protein
VIVVLPELVTTVTHAWPLATLALPKLVRELRRLVYARAVDRLSRAAIEKEWSDERFRLVVTLIRDVDRNSAPGRIPSEEPPKDDLQ